MHMRTILYHSFNEKKFNNFQSVLSFCPSVLVYEERDDSERKKRRVLSVLPPRVISNERSRKENGR